MAKPIRRYQTHSGKGNPNGFDKWEVGIKLPNLTKVIQNLQPTCKVYTPEERRAWAEARGEVAR